MKIKVQAQHLQPGDMVSSGEKVEHVSAGTLTPKGKVDVWLDTRMACWGKYTMINVERVNG